MLVKDFVDGNIAIRIYDDVELSELESLEAAINEVAGRHLGETQNCSGFTQFCLRRLKRVRKDFNVNGIDVAMNNIWFGYMRAGTTWYQDNRHIEVIDVCELLDELNINRLGRVSYDEFDAVFA